MLRPTPIDNHPTPTSYDQRETERILSSLLSESPYPPTLNRNTHLNFLARALFQGFPKHYTAQDASQPWFMFWLLQAFNVLGAGLDPANKQRAIDTILKAQHPDGGFGGGPKQAPHLLPTYAAVSALAIVGRPGEGGGWDQINRKGMYDFFLSLKQPDGSFHVSKHGEVDIRGTYCLLATATLLNLLTPTLTANIPGFIRSCQTYEGGFASASQPYYDPDGNLMHSPRPALGEAHGGYTACALGSWMLLKPVMSDEEREGREGILKENVVRWLAKMQGGEMDLGGFRGRTNKLVDGCYSWWVGGCFALLEGLGVKHDWSAIDGEPQSASVPESADADADAEWDDIEDELYNTKALQEYILIAAQVSSGGLRDKPPKNPDAYHTSYNLAGLSTAQHRVRIVEPEYASMSDDPLLISPDESSTERDTRRRKVYETAYYWKEVESQSRVLGGMKNRVNATHPLFNLTVTHARGMLRYFYGQS
ncbi:terpenoid cyclases/protein prenyltransferase alpha-alpha toroid [Hysterangium stoloniferum]|nr:terpenoid cyclases/protein prenyltransferase alpha-alpha toroid [Hysterangium stoloniferum]